MSMRSSAWTNCIRNNYQTTSSSGGEPPLAQSLRFVWFVQACFENNVVPFVSAHFENVPWRNFALAKKECRCRDRFQPVALPGFCPPFVLFRVSFWGKHDSLQKKFSAHRWAQTKIQNRQKDMLVPHDHSFSDFYVPLRQQDQVLFPIWCEYKYLKLFLSSDWPFFRSVPIANRNVLEWTSFR